MVVMHVMAEEQGSNGFTPYSLGIRRVYMSDDAVLPCAGAAEAPRAESDRYSSVQLNGRRWSGFREGSQALPHAVPQKGEDCDCLRG